MHRDDVRMAQPGQGLRLAFEAFREPRVLFFFAGQDLERDEAIEPGLARLIHHSHSPTAQGFEDFELGKAFGDFL